MICMQCKLCFSSCCECVSSCMTQRKSAIHNFSNKWLWMLFIPAHPFLLHVLYFLTWHSAFSHLFFFFFFLTVTTRKIRSDFCNHLVYASERLDLPSAGGCWTRKKTRNPMNFMITIQAQQGFSGTCMHFLKFNRCLCGLYRCWCWAYLVRSLIVGDCSQSKPMHQLSTCRCVFSFDLLPSLPRKDTYEGREILRKCVWTCGLACVRASDAILSLSLIHIWRCRRGP